MKKTIYLFLLAVFLLCVPGCSRKEKGNDSKLGAGIVSEDFQRGNDSIMKTEKGYYYYDPEGKAIRYYDIATGKDMYLCNKPECRHDGNAFCVATNEKYMMNRLWLYSNRIFAAVVEETDTQYLYKVLTIALDGSEMSEFATYMTLEKTGQRPLGYSAGALVCHRNKVMIPMGAAGEDGFEDTYYYGTAILDLDTKETTYLDKEPLSKENPVVEEISAYKEHIYYYKKNGKKKVLHRYNVADGTEESYTLQPGFTGDYVVLDEDNIVYRRSFENVIFLYHPSTGVSEEFKRLMITRSYLGVDGSELESKESYRISRMMTDGTYFYVLGSPATYILKDGTEQHKLLLRVLDHDFEEVVTINLAEIIPMKDDLEEGQWRWGEVNVLGEDLYFGWRGATETIYKCKRSDFLEGNPELEALYKLHYY